MTGGNIGIGTTAPVKTLDINGDLRVISLSTGTLQVTNAVSTNISTGTLHAIDGITVSNINFIGSLYQNGSPYVGSQWTTTSGNISYTSGSVITNKLSATGDSNTFGNIFTTGGNIGINTTSPFYAFDVRARTNIVAEGTYQLLISNPSGQCNIDMFNQTRYARIYYNTLNMFSISNYNTTFFMANTVGNVRFGFLAPYGSGLYKVGVDGSMVINTMNNTCNKLFVLYDGSVGESATTGTTFYGLGVNTGTLRYQVDSTSSAHRFYCGATNYYQITSAGGANVSDRRYKSDIVNISGALDKIEKLQGITFKMENLEKRQMGFIAQDVKAIIPEVIQEDNEGINYMSYDKITALLVEGIKELKSKNDLLQSQMDLVKVELASLSAVVRN